MFIQNCSIVPHINCTITALNCINKVFNRVFIHDSLPLLKLLKMNKEKLYQPFEIIYKRLDECPKGEHRHLFFELAFIISGRGLQCINNNKMEYRAGHMFLITPEDCHSWEITETSEFFFLRFTDIYIKSAGFRLDDIRRLEFILENASHQPGCILKNFSDKPVVRSLVEAMIAESVNRDLYNQELIARMVDTIIVIVARNIAKYMPSSVKEYTDSRVMDMLNYIQANIYDPAKLRMGELAQHFNMSEHYISKYFKTQTGENLQRYIINLRLKLIEARLRFSDRRLGEISDELGFADESHFNKFFKKASGKSPSQFRKEFYNTKDITE